jgi:hypothetical protein
LAQLQIAAEAPRAGYDRGLFRHWIDDDDDGCNARDEVLIAESDPPARLASISETELSLPADTVAILRAAG